MDSLSYSSQAPNNPRIGFEPHRSDMEKVWIKLVRQENQSQIKPAFREVLFKNMISAVSDTVW